MNVFVVGNVPAYMRMFYHAGYNLVDNVREADIVQFCGGPDVSPSLYGQAVHPYTRYQPELDRLEVGVFHECVAKEKKMVGICRGGQFLCALSGGDLYQHVDNHSGTHDIIDCSSGDTISVSSTHHQMMLLPDDATLIAYADGLAACKESMDDFGNTIKDRTDSVDVEAMFIHSINALCFQPHPEIGPDSCRDYFFQLIQRYL